MKPYFGPMVLLLSLSAGLSAVILYVLLKKDNDDDNSEPSASAIYTAHQTKIKVKIPKDMVGVLIGRQGASAKKIQQESGARVFLDRCETSNDDFRVCTIFGTADQAQKAETLIHEFLQNQPKYESFEMFVNRRYIGRIIGRNGCNVIHIKNTSHAKIDITDYDCDQSRITLKGTNDQIAIARDLIQNIIKEHSSSLEKLQDSIQNRSPRVRPIPPLNGVPQLPPNLDDSHFEILRPPGGRESLDVFVSGLVNPGQFWVQVINEHGTKLDKLLDDMTIYYNNPENRELHKLSELNEEQIVAAVFPDDEKWYRAKVVAVIEDDEKERQVVVSYVDYGDSRTVHENEVLELRTDFLTLRFQAIECFLAGLKPKNETWSEEAVDMFEALTHVAQWKKLMLVIKTYSYVDRQKASGQQSTRFIPGVELFDQQEGCLINIGEELVKAGFAEKVDDAANFETEDFNAGPTTSANQHRAVPELSDSESDIDGFYIE